MSGQLLLSPCSRRWEAPFERGLAWGTSASVVAFSRAFSLAHLGTAPPLTLPAEGSTPKTPAKAANREGQHRRLAGTAACHWEAQLCREAPVSGRYFETRRKRAVGLRGAAVRLSQNSGGKVDGAAK